MCEDKFEFNKQRQKPKILTELMLMLTEQCQMVIRDTLGYNLYIVGYVQQNPFFHNIHHPTQIFCYIFCRSFSIFKRITKIPEQLFHSVMYGAQN